MFARVKKWFLNLYPIELIIKLSKRIVLPGFNGLPLYNVLKFFIVGIQKGAIQQRASSMAFSFFLALFPLILFLFTIIPFIPIDNFQEELLLLVENILPESLFVEIESTLVEIIKQPNGGLLSFGFIAAFYFSTNGFNSMLDAFNSTYHNQVQARSGLSTRLVSFLLVIILSVLLITAISLLVFTEVFLNNFTLLKPIISYLIVLGEWLIILSLFFCVISFTYYLGPSSKTKWRFINAGASFSTTLCILASLAFTQYINNFGQYNKLYGSIGTILVLLLWIYFNSLVLLLGFELNASITQAKSTQATLA